MADHVDIDLYADDLEQEFNQEGDFGASSSAVDLYDDVITTPSNGQSGEFGGDGSGSSQPQTTQEVAAPVQAPPSSNVPDARSVPFHAKRVSLYVGNMTWWTTDADLTDAIQGAGVTDLQEIKFYENRANGQSKGFAVVHVGSENSYRVLMERLPKKELHGQMPIVLPCNRQSLQQLENSTKKSGGHHGGGPNSGDNRSGPPNRGPRGMMQGNQQRPPMGHRGGMGPRGYRPPGQPGPPVGQGGLMPPGPYGAPPRMIQAPMPPRMIPPPRMGSIPGISPPDGMPRLPPGSLMKGPPPRLDQRGPPPRSDWDRPPALFSGPPPGAPGGPLSGPPGGPPPPLRMPPQTSTAPPLGPPGQQPPPGHAPPVPHINPAFFPPGQGPTDSHRQSDQYNSRPYDDRASSPPLSETEFEDIMSRNRTVSSSAISRAVSDASNADYASAIETLVTAISLIKQSKVATDDRCKVLISSLQDCLHGIESKSYGSGSRRDRERSREHEERSHRPREKTRHKERDRPDRRERSRSHERVDYRDRSRDEYRDRERERDRERDYRRSDGRR